MKAIVILGFLFSAAGCLPHRRDTALLESKIDSLQNRLEHSYKPGFGEFMSGIQVHHAKLWFAGINENWKLAEFEIQEIKEGIEDLMIYNTDRPESKDLPMIKPALDSIASAVGRMDTKQFRSSFQLLTNTCNECHRITNHEFNVVIIPLNLPVTNQDFKPHHSDQIN